MAAATWLKATTGALEKGYKGLIGAGSPDFECCGSYSKLLEFENALDKMLKGQPVMRVCSYKENASLKKLVADLSLDNAILKDVSRGNF